MNKLLLNLLFVFLLGLGAEAKEVWRQFEVGWQWADIELDASRIL